MMSERLTLLDRLSGAREDALLRQVKANLALDETRLVGDRSTRVSVAEALRLWSTRLGNEDLTGQHLQGAENLLVNLQKLAGQRKLEQYAFVNSVVGGNIFFEGPAPRQFVGAILFELPKKHVFAREV